ncbi:MAG: sucrase ferredoxin [Chloroflexi bacterium]|nr:sucrase ferredoxin [Chloroflexota bacterium]
MTISDTPTKTYCNCLAQDRGLDPVGHGGYFDDCLVLEAPLPWKNDMYQTAGTLPQALIDLLALWLQDYHAGKGYPHLPLLIAPDKSYSREGYRRVMLFTRPSGAFARFDKVEYLVPIDEVNALVWALYQDRDALSRFEGFRVPNADDIRDLLVCTHGTVDAACSKFGYPLYRHLRADYATETLRVWRVSHFGGHVFAPTLMDMPTGHYWAYVGREQAAPIIRREGEVAALRGHYRGWAGVSAGFQQAAECALWQRYGWRWFVFPRTAASIEQSKHAAVVRITHLDGAEQHTEVHIEVSKSISTPHSTNDASTYPYSQYRVV